MFIDKNGRKRAFGQFASEPKNITRQLLRRKAEDGILPGPFGRQIDEASYPHPVRKPPLYGGSDQIRREERKRDRHIHLADAAALSFCDAFAGCCWIPDQFIEPTTSTGDRRDQRCAIL